MQRIIRDCIITPTTTMLTFAKADIKLGIDPVLGKVPRISGEFLL
jgi:hypothetical protein